MIELAWVLTILLSFVGGYFHRELREKIKVLETNVVNKVKPKEQNTDSIFLDPDDVVQVARFEQEEIQRKLNPEKYDS